MSNILIVHAHHEAQSFSSSMAKTTADTLAAEGHQVVFSDLHAMNFQPVSDRRNFTTTANADYLRQQPEEAYAHEHQGFAPELETEIQKLEACDLLIFSFPLWWFGMPALLKGWVDRVFAYKRIYSRGQWYENGVGKGKRAMVLMTTGGSAAKYGQGGLHATINTVLAPIHQGIFWFNGFSPLPPFVAWEAAHGTDDDRHAILENLRTRMTGIFIEPAIELPHVADFDPVTAIDTLPRFMVTVKQVHLTEPPQPFPNLRESTYLQNLHRQGKLLSLQISSSNNKQSSIPLRDAGATPFFQESGPSTINPSADWRCFLVIRERSAEQVRSLCEGLPLASYLSFEITALETTQAI